MNNEPHYLILTSTQVVVHDADEVAKFLKLKQRDWEGLDPEQFQQLIDTGVGTFKAGNGATSVRILQVKADGEQQPIDKPLKEEA